MWKLFGGLVVFRIANALFVRTYFNPDEFWQSSEVAHHMVFGYGYLTWEWQSNARLRGYAHPSIFALLFKALEWMKMDTAWAIAYSPRILQGIFTAVTDFYVYRLANAYFGSSIAIFSLFCQLSSWFTFFALSRTFSNSMEACCTTIALSYWPWSHLSIGQEKKHDDTMNESHQNLRLAYIFAALGCIFRPTNAVVWIFLTAKYFLQSGNRLDFLFQLLLPIGVLSIGIMLLIDRIGYGEWTFVPYNFVKFNVFEGKDKLYGVHPWYWYFLAGYPEITATYLPFILLAGYTCHKKNELGALILWSLSIYSLGAHKEPRFLLPLLPASFVYAGKGLQLIQDQRYFKVLLGFFVVANGVAAVYFSRIHQRAPLDVMDYLAGNVQSTDSIDFFLPCHATPYLGHLHMNVSCWFPTCTPEERERSSPSDKLRRDPLSYAIQRYNDRTKLPTYLVMYSSSSMLLQEKLKAWQFSLMQEFPHCDISMDADSPVPDTHMVVYRRNKNTK